MAKNLKRMKRRPAAQREMFRGGRREGAGRPRSSTRVAHGKRPDVKARLPMHVTVRIRSGLPRLRNFELVKVLKRAFVGGCDKPGFRICQFSIQTNHIHLICEAADNAGLARGMQGWCVRVARGLNRELERDGSVFDDRYHVEIITMPKQMRNVYCYVLQNARHHGVDVGNVCHGVDLYSSAWWFDGWSRDDWRTGLKPPDTPSVAPARSWLATTGWRRHGLIGVTEAPAEKRSIYRAPPEHATGWWLELA